MMQKIWNIKIMLEDFFKSKSLQEFINHRFKDDSVYILPKDVAKYITTSYATFNYDSMLSTLSDIKEYDISDLKSTDIVLDVGACIGAFSLKVANKVKHVYSVEPMMVDKLKNNLNLNNVKNITIIEKALGDGDLDLEYHINKRKIKGTSLTELIQLCGGHIDFLKCDCEGGELSIKSEELKGIRCIEMEVHCSKERFKKFKKMLDEANFEYKYTGNPSINAYIIHAHAKN